MKEDEVTSYRVEGSVPLLPCPFCGDATRINAPPNGTQKSTFVLCMRCGGSGPNSWGHEDNAPYAIAAWNRRPVPSRSPSPEVGELVERLRDRDAIVLGGLFHAIPALREAADMIESLSHRVSEARRALEEAATRLQSKADLYKAYAERALSQGDQAKAAMMDAHYATTMDDIRAIRSLPSPEVKDG